MATRWTISELLICIALTCFPTALPAAAGGLASRPKVHAVQYGVDLSLLLPQAVFPRNALVLATVQLRNRSPLPITMSSEPEVTVMDRAGREVYMAQQGTYLQVFRIGSPFARGGTGAVPVLQPGRSLTRHIFLILRADQIEASVTISHGPSSIDRTVATAPLAVQLVQGTAPRIAFTKRWPHIYAIISPTSTAQRGTLWFVYIEECGGQHETGMDIWTPVPGYDWTGHGYELEDDCLGSVEAWHLAAGWLNQPVQIVDCVLPCHWKQADGVLEPST